MAFGVLTGRVIRGIGSSAPSVSPSGEGKIYFDSTLNQFMVSQNGAAYVALVGGGGGTTYPVAPAGGSYSTSAGGANATALGDTANASGGNTLAVGFGAQATDDFCVVLGPTATAGDPHGTVVGYGAVAGGNDATAIGYTANASNNQTVAIGSTSQATFGSAIAVGYGANSGGVEAIAIGPAAVASNSFAVALGSNTSAGFNSASLGPYISSSGQNTIAAGANISSVVNQAVLIGQGVTTDSTAGGGVAIGQGASLTNGGGSIAIGQGASSGGSSNTVLGQFAVSNGFQSVSLGWEASANHSKCIAIGTSSLATGDNQFVVGGLGSEITDLYFGASVASPVNDTGRFPSPLPNATIHGTGGVYIAEIPDPSAPTASSTNDGAGTLNPGDTYNVAITYRNKNNFFGETNLSPLTPVTISGGDNAILVSGLSLPAGAQSIGVFMETAPGSGIMRLSTTTTSASVTLTAPPILGNEAPPASNSTSSPGTGFNIGLMGGAADPATVGTATGGSTFVYGGTGSSNAATGGDVRLGVAVTGSATTVTDVLFVSASNGNVGIGAAPGAFKLDVTGDVHVSGKLTVDGAIDPPSLSLSGGTALFFDSANGSTAPLSASGHGRIRYNNGTLQWEQSVNGGAYAAFGGATYAIAPSGGTATATGTNAFAVGTGASTGSNANSLAVGVNASSGVGSAAVGSATTAALTSVAIGGVPTSSIAAGSAGQTLPQATIFAVTPNLTFPRSGTVTVVTSNGPQTVSYTFCNGTSFQGCTGGTGTMSLGGAITGQVTTANSPGATVVGIGAQANGIGNGNFQPTMTAMGWYAQAGLPVGRSYAPGTTSVTDCIAIGDRSMAGVGFGDSSDCIAIGDFAAAGPRVQNAGIQDYGAYSDCIYIGDGGNAGGNGIGSSDCIGIGDGAGAQGASDCIAIGDGTQAGTDIADRDCVAIGDGASAQGRGMQGIPTDGVTTVFSGTVNSTPVLPTSGIKVFYVIGGVTYTTTATNFNDSTVTQAITGTHITSGSINFVTGAWTITFNTPPDATSNFGSALQIGVACNDAVAIGNGPNAGHSFSVCLGTVATTTAPRQFVVGGPFNNTHLTDGYFGAGVKSGNAADRQGFIFHATGGQSGGQNGAPLGFAGGLGGAATDHGGNLNFWTARDTTANTLTLTGFFNAADGSFSVPGGGGSAERFGSGAQATGFATTAVGDSAAAGGASGGTAVGWASQATGVGSIALGPQATAGDHQLVVGHVNFEIKEVYFGGGASSTEPAAVQLFGTKGVNVPAITDPASAFTLTPVADGLGTFANGSSYQVAYAYVNNSTNGTTLLSPPQTFTASGTDSIQTSDLTPLPAGVETVAYYVSDAPLPGGVLRFHGLANGTPQTIHDVGTGNTAPVANTTARLGNGNTVSLVGGNADPAATTYAPAGSAVVSSGYDNQNGGNTNGQRSQLFVSGQVKFFRDNIADAFAILSTNANDSIGCSVFFTVRATDGTEEQVYAGMFSASAINKAGTVQVDDSPTIATTTKASAGSLSATMGVTTDGLGNLELTCDPNSAGITPTSITLTYTIIANGSTTIMPVAWMASVSNGSPNVAGINSLFTTTLAPGQFIRFANQPGTIYEILSITDDTNLVLTTNFTGATNANVAMLTP